MRLAETAQARDEQLRRLARRQSLLEGQLAACRAALAELAAPAGGPAMAGPGRPRHGSTPELLTRRQIAMLSGLCQRTVANLLARGGLADRHPVTVGAFVRARGPPRTPKAPWQELYASWRGLESARARARKCGLTRPLEGAEMAQDATATPRRGELHYEWDEGAVDES